ncbi:MAG: type II toxin-antitoxin system RelE/ParE family toxin [Candidatus Hydrogenedentes bacterium]|nr:type II toxin-antitoxin system RelE/ParE family toxin [Candidatus Hydrogenedentota bacterium]
MNLTIHPGAQSDLDEAAEFSRNTADVALSKSFLEGFDQSSAMLQRYPQLGSCWRSGRRRLVMQRFPYSIIYSVSADEIRILAVAHQSRRPNYWRQRK